MSRRSGVGGATAAAVVLLAVGTHPAYAAPATDERGFVESWASCASPSTAVAFGSTDTSRVAVCKSSGDQYQYRGVRVRDGARLAIDATPSGANGYVAEGDGISYTVTPTALLVSEGEKVIRDEPWVTYSGPGAAASATAPTPTTPLPPPLPAEVGHS